MLKTEGLSKIVDYFIHDRRVSNLSPTTLKWYRDKLNNFLDFCPTDNIEEINPQTIREYIFYLGETGHNSGGIHGFYRALRALLNFYENEFEPENWKNPINKVKPPKVIVEPIQGVDLGIIKKLVDSCGKSTFYGERDRTILLLLTETGIRASELLQIDIDDIDFSDSSILIRMGKGRKPRSVFIGSIVRRQLRKYLKYSKSKKALFTTISGSRLTYAGLREIMRRLSDKVGIPEVNLHDFRRTFALTLLRTGVDVYTISRLMGHTSLAVLSRYLKQSKDDLRNSYKSILDSN